MKAPAYDERLAALSEWVAAALRQPQAALRPASADASFRRYFRVDAGDGTTLIAMDAPPDKEDCRPYVRIAAAFRRLGLNVPEVVAQDLERGFLLITDLGEQLYLGALHAGNAERLYGDALRALARLQAAPLAQFQWLPPYDAALLRREMELFREWYLGRHLALPLARADHTALDRAFEFLAQTALAQPRVPVHRDYHSRNLMVTPRDNPGILDFQDAVVGPVTYDLVSLLRDCYVDWPAERVRGWAAGYRAFAVEAGVPVGPSEQLFLRWFDLMGVQRHLKATGIFARLYHRDGKAGYLKDIPRTLGYVLAVAPRYPELADLAELLQRAAGAAEQPA